MPGGRRRRRSVLRARRESSLTATPGRRDPRVPAVARPPGWRAKAASASPHSLARSRSARPSPSPSMRVDPSGPITARASRRAKTRSGRSVRSDVWPGCDRGMTRSRECPSSKVQNPTQKPGGRVFRATSAETPRATMGGSLAMPTMVSSPWWTAATVRSGDSRVRTAAARRSLSRTSAKLATGSEAAPGESPGRPASSGGVVSWRRRRPERLRRA